MTRQSPGVRRLCVGASAPHQPGLLATACRAGGFGRLYIEHNILAEHLELAFASPGVDEAVLVTDMLAALRTAAGCGEVANLPCAPAVVAFHVGITHVVGDALTGAAVFRLRELIRDLSPVAAAARCGVLVAGLSDGLFGDIGQECGLAPDWAQLQGAKAWFRVYHASHGGAPHRPLH